jgi:hypothetical protein
MVEDMFEVSMRWPGRSCGTAGGAHSQLNRVAQQLNERSSETLGFEIRAERDLMLVLHRPIEPTVISGHGRISDQCPLYPQKRTWIGTVMMSALCHNRT